MNNLLKKNMAWLFVFLVSTCLVMLSGCASDPATADAKSAQFSESDYLIGAGDTINVIVWRNPEVSMVVTVRPDGKISTPLVEDIVADGKTPSILAREIESKLAKFIQSPVVTVVVTSFSGPYQEQVRVIGQAVKPQALAYRHGMTIMDVIIAVGGITEFASGNKANIIRNVNGTQVKINVRLNDLINDGDISANIPVRPGDVLLIPQSFF